MKDIDTQPDWGVLFVCATPIGNLNDCSFRLIETLKKVKYIAAEDTRVAKKLLARYNINTPTVSLQKYNEASRIDLFDEWLKKGHDIALVSDAGTPNISDPGSYLIKNLINKNHKIAPIPGTSAVTTLISVSGILANKFCFLGFFPNKFSEAKKLLDNISDASLPCVFFISGRNIIKSIEWLAETYQIQELVIGKELTKKFETCLYGEPKSILTELKKNVLIKGEWTLMFNFKINEDEKTEERIKYLSSLGLSAKQIKGVAELLNISKNKVYDLLFPKKK